MAPAQPIQIVEYIDLKGRSNFALWFNSLDGRTAARVRSGLGKLSNGNTSAIKGLGGDLQELRLDFGPGYRLYLTRRGDTLVILFAGGSKRTQSNDIDVARQLLLEYKQQQTVRK